MQDRLALRVPCGLLQMPGRSRPDATYATRGARVAGPGGWSSERGSTTATLRVRRSVGAVRGPRPGLLTSADRPRPEPTRRRPAPRIPPAGPDRRSRSPRGRRTTRGRGGYRRRTRAAPATSPPNWPHRPGPARTASPRGRDQVHGVGSSAHEPSPVGHHRPDRLPGSRPRRSARPTTSASLGLGREKSPTSSSHR